MTSKRLLKIKGFSDIKVEKIKDAAKKLMVSRPIIDASTILIICQPTASGFVTAAEMAERRKRCVRISTGSKQLDTALNG